MTCHIGHNVIVCTSTGKWKVDPSVPCPWCLEDRWCLYAEVYGGWCGRDYICGTCGTYWSSDSESICKHSEEEREENIAQVASVPDPKCWDCHDTSWLRVSPVNTRRKRCKACRSKREEA